MYRLFSFGLKFNVWRACTGPQPWCWEPLLWSIFSIFSTYIHALYFFKVYCCTSTCRLSLLHWWDVVHTYNSFVHAFVLIAKNCSYWWRLFILCLFQYIFSSLLSSFSRVSVMSQSVLPFGKNLSLCSLQLRPAGPPRPRHTTNLHRPQTRSSVRWDSRSVDRKFKDIQNKSLKYK